VDLDDFVEPEVGVAVAVTAGVATIALSPTVRRWLRRGAVYSMAGLLMAKDKMTDFARNVRNGVKEPATATGPAGPEPSQAPAHSTP